jgi:hypothetical protein
MEEAAMTRYVNVYEVSRAYGGSEEGGWWYDTGWPILSLPIPDCLPDPRTAALEMCLTLRLDYPETGRRGSVLGGEDYGVYIETEPAAPYPEYQPRYE